MSASTGYLHCGEQGRRSVQTTSVRSQVSTFVQRKIRGTFFILVFRYRVPCKYRDRGVWSVEVNVS